jgi:protein-tyrosine-phosphatase
MTSAHRQFKLRIWGLALGYFIFYAPYGFLTKVLTTRLWPGIDGPVSGFRLLPAVIISTAGLGTAIIIGTTTLAFTFTAVSIVFALLLMRGGVLIIAPLVDHLFKRRVRWFSWVALALTLPALLITLADVNNYRMNIVVALSIFAYLLGYTLRLPCVTKLAKSDDKATTYRYFVEEQMVAMLFLVAIPALFALIGKGEIMMELRQGFTGLFSSSITLPAFVIGALYACLYCFGTLIYLDCRENTFCIPLNRGSSLLAGLFATYALALFFGLKPPSEAQLGSAVMIVMALLFLSPLHHLQRTLNRFSHSLASLYRLLKDFVNGFGKREPVAEAGLQLALAENIPALRQGTTDQESFDKLRQLFLFVCSGNTCRSPMAAAIGNAEIATRLQIPFEALDQAHVRALSAGVSARWGAPMTQEAQQALRLLNIPVVPHAARNLTVELAHQVEMIFCMTRAHREAVIDMIPSVAGKTHCLDPEADIEDPIGRGLEAYLNCASHIHRLVRWRLDEAQLNASL